IAFGYYQVSWLFYVLCPAWSYRLNADFEDHAEHEYMALVAEHPEWETEPFDSVFAADYAELDTVADLFLQLGYDERLHKRGSVARPPDLHGRHGRRRGRRRLRAGERAGTPGVQGEAVRGHRRRHPARRHHRLQLVRHHDERHPDRVSPSGADRHRPSLQPAPP